MLDGRKFLGVIPARGGSKGVPRKNLRSVGGKPLLAWTIEAAKKSRYLDRVILSSEDREIVDVARAWGCEVPFMRPPELAQDDIRAVEAVIHAMDRLPGYEYAVLLQVTSPLRDAEDIDGCIEKCVRSCSYACCTVTEVEQSPYWMYSLGERDVMKPLIGSNHGSGQRQKVPKVFVPNGAVYVVERKYLLEKRSFLTEETVGYTMERQKSLDLDSEMDFRFLNFWLESGEKDR